MNHQNETTVLGKATDAKDARALKAIASLMALEGDQKQVKLREFKKFYPAVLQALRRKVPRKLILKHLRDGGLKLYPALFEEFVAALEGSDEGPEASEEAILCKPQKRSIEEGAGTASFASAVDSSEALE